LRPLPKPPRKNSDARKGDASTTPPAGRGSA
jgi:hypothetical protein